MDGGHDVADEPERGIGAKAPQLARQARVEHASQDRRAHGRADAPEELGRRGGHSQELVLERVLHRQREDGQGGADAEPGRDHAQDQRQG